MSEQDAGAKLAHAVWGVTLEPLAKQIADAKAEVARLERIAQTATCSDLGHDWKSMGGANCGCDEGHCSVPVHECSRCGDCDYGENEWAGRQREACAARTA
jgi:hypothetical protein